MTGLGGSCTELCFVMIPLLNVSSQCCCNRLSSMRFSALSRSLTQCRACCAARLLSSQQRNQMRHGIRLRSSLWAGCAICVVREAAQLANGSARVASCVLTAAMSRTSAQRIEFALPGFVARRGKASSAASQGMLQFCDICRTLLGRISFFEMVQHVFFTASSTLVTLNYNRSI